MAMVFGSGAVALGVWAAVVWMHDKVPGGALLAFLAIVASRLCHWHSGEACRLFWLGNNERVSYERPLLLMDEDFQRECQSWRVWGIALALVVVVPAMAAAVAIWKFNH